MSAGRGQAAGAGADAGVGAAARVLQLQRAPPARGRQGSLIAARRPPVSSSTAVFRRRDPCVILRQRCPPWPRLPAVARTRRPSASRGASLGPTTLPVLTFWNLVRRSSCKEHVCSGSAQPSIARRGRAASTRPARPSATLPRSQSVPHASALLRSPTAPTAAAAFSACTVGLRCPTPAVVPCGSVRPAAHEDSPQLDLRCIAACPGISAGASAAPLSQNRCFAGAA